MLPKKLKKQQNLPLKREPKQMLRSSTILLAAAPSCDRVFPSDCPFQFKELQNFTTLVVSTLVLAYALTVAHWLSCACIGYCCKQVGTLLSWRTDRGKGNHPLATAMLKPIVANPFTVIRVIRRCRGIWCILPFA